MAGGAPPAPATKLGPGGSGDRPRACAVGRAVSQVRPGLSCSRTYWYPCVAAVKLAPMKPKCSRAACIDSSSKSSIRPTAPASAVFTIGTLRVPNWFSRAILRTVDGGQTVVRKLLRRTIPAGQGS